MKDFSNIKFKGTFRSYQQRVLDRKNLYLSNGKIHIVAAPGSGKTILGLELIRQLDSPAIILSPTTTIKHQWGDRFHDAFLPSNEDSNGYLSYDLNEIKLITSITYQALYSAMNKVKVESEDEVIDYSNLDLFKLIEKNKVKTICLDEAHHLQNEWQKALEKFVQGLNKEIKIIALTATPPYDASKGEWERYISVCGEIDEEIFVPELVKQETLAPHQDYIYFNYPSIDELDAVKGYQTKVIDALRDIKKLGFYKEVLQKIDEIFKISEEFIFEHVNEILSLFVLLNAEGYYINRQIVKTLRRKQIPTFSFLHCEKAIDFLITNEYLLNLEQREEIIKVLKKHDTFEYKKVCLTLKEKDKKKLLSSVGKLDSIVKITEHEFNNLKDDLRLLILTDYIRKETIKDIGSNTPLTSINIVTIFESIRVEVPKIKLAVLSGSLVILHNSLDKEITIKHTKQPLVNTEYSVYKFNSDNKVKVNFITKLFEAGKIQALVGTKSLLGEGWDSPSINSLILATFVGSFMLSNQMRGRAIRKNPKDLKKVSNIWHLVTLTPTYLLEDSMLKFAIAKMDHDFNKIESYDYDTLTNRFESFVGPNYKTGDIESGIARISIIKPPYNASNIEKINKEMLERSKNRTSIKANWDESLTFSQELVLETDVPKERIIPIKLFYNIPMIIALIAINLITYSIYIISPTLIENAPDLSLILYIAALITLIFGSKIVANIFTKGSSSRIMHHISKSLLKTLQELDLIANTAYIKTEYNKINISMAITLKGAVLREQNIFNQGLNEMLSMIDNPRYVIIFKKKTGRVYKYSFAVPEIIGEKKERVELFIERLKRYVGSFDFVYTRNEAGRKELLECRHKSYITYTERLMNKKKKILN